MNTSLFSFLFCIIIATVAATLSTAATSGPGWVTKNDVAGGTSGITLAAGDPFLGRAGTINYVIGSSQNFHTQNTTICTFEPNFNGTCVESILELNDINNFVDPVLVASYFGAFLITVRNNSDLTTTTHRWSSIYGIEWSLRRGNVKSQFGTQLVDPANQLDFCVKAAPTGLADIISIGETSGRKRVVKNTMLLPIPSWKVKPNTAYAGDLTFLQSSGGNDFLGGVSLGRAFAFNFKDQAPTTLVEKPCGYNITDFRGLPVTVYGTTNNHYQYLLYGNDPVSGDFVICALASNSSLTELWNITVPGGITPFRGDSSVQMIHTQHDDGLYPATVNYLYISGYTGGDNTKNTLFAFDIAGRKLAWTKPRLLLDANNMPVVVRAKDYKYIAVSVQGIMISIDPVSPNTNIWSCSKQQLGCSNTPAIYPNPDRNANVVARMMCVDANSETNIIAFDVDTSDTHECILQWNDVVPNAIDSNLQREPSISTNSVYPAEPFAVFLDVSSIIWSFSFRSAAEPQPTPRPTPGPTPAPTFPSGNFPAPKKVLYTPPPVAYESIAVQDPAVIRDFTKDGPIMAAVALVKDKTKSSMEDPETADFHMRNPEFSKKVASIKTYDDETGEEEIGVGVGNYQKILYFEAIPIGGLDYFVYGVAGFSYQANVAPPVVVNAGTYSFVVATYEILGSSNARMLYTNGNAKKPQALIHEFSRFGAIGAMATDGAGTLVYSTGVYNRHENIVAIVEKGNGQSRVEYAWFKEFSAPPGQKFDNLTSHIGDIVFAMSGIKQYYAFSYLNVLHFVTASSSLHSFVNFTNPCGFQPSKSTFLVYYPMDLYWVHDNKENLVVAAIDTWDQHGDYSYGFCSFDLTQAQPTVLSGVPVKNVSIIGNVQPIGNANVYAIDILNTKYRGEIIVLESTMQRELWRADRDNAYGYTIVGVAGSSVFVTNMDSVANNPYDTDMQLSVVDAKTGTIHGQCDYAFEEFALVPGSDSNSIGIVGSIYGDHGQWERFVRYVKFVNNGNGDYSCSVVWEQDLGAEVSGISSVAITVKEVDYVSIVTSDGKIYSLTLEAGATPTPAPPLPPGDVPEFTVQTNLSSYWKNPISRQPTFPPILFGDLLKIGIPAFATVVAGYTGKPDAASAEQTEDGDPIKLYGALIAFDATTASKTPSEVQPEAHWMLDSQFTPTSFPMSLFNNFGFTGEKVPAKAAVAWTSYDADPFLYIISYPGTRYRWKYPRFGGLSDIASDGNGRLFWSVGAYKGREGFYAAEISQDGTELKDLWNVSVISGDPGKIYNLSSGIGNAEWVFTHNKPSGYVSFSFEHSLYFLDADNGYRAAQFQDPCGYTPPNNANNENFPYPMNPKMVELDNHSVVVATLINRGPGVDDGSWGLCGIAVDGFYTAWKADLPTSIDHFIKVLPLFFSNYILISAVSAVRGGGILIGVDARTGAQWMVPRKNAVGTIPAPLPLTNDQGKYFVANMDSTIPNEDKVQYLSVGELDSGKVVAQCPFACAINPIRAFVQFGDSMDSVKHYFVCTLEEHPLTLRSIEFVPSSNTNNIFDCKTYWDYQLPVEANGVFLVDHSYISASLVNGGTATVSMISHNSASGGNNPSNPAPSGGMSGGAVAALVICMLILVSVIGFVVYYTKFRSIRRSAISEAQSGLEYGSGSSTSAAGTGIQSGYGSTTAGEV